MHDRPPHGVHLTQGVVDGRRQLRREAESEIDRGRNWQMKALKTFWSRNITPSGRRTVRTPLNKQVPQR